MTKTVQSKRKSTLLNGVFLFGVVIVAALALPTTLSASATCTWSGGGSDNLASTAANWSSGVAPQAGDAILLDATSSKDLTWDLDIAVSSWSQTDYNGTVTLLTLYGNSGFTNFVITGDCTINSGTWTHPEHPSNQNTELNRLRLSVGGNFNLGAAAAFDVTGKGFALRKGPGSLGSGEHGGSYGGTGRNSLGRCYGSISHPVNPGSGGRDSGGGGTIHLTVGGNATLDGKLLANGEPTTSFSGSGGTVFVTAGSISAAASGLLQANSGALTTMHSPGGGGRVAIVLTDTGADFTSFAATCEALGSPLTISGAPSGNRSGTGTIYFETAAQPAGGGDLLIKGTGQPVTEGLYTPLDDRSAATFDFASITITNNGVLEIGSDDTLFVTNTVLHADPTSGLDAINIVGSGQVVTPAEFTLDNLQVMLRTASGLFHPAQKLTLGANTELIAYAAYHLAGDLTLVAGAMLTCPPNSDTEVYKLNLTVDGDLTVAAGGVISVANKGYAPEKGPGAPYGQNGATHGGRGGITGTLDTTVPEYGSIYNPLNLGSGGRWSWRGGGAIRAVVGGTLTLNGSLLSNVAADHNYNSSGGSIAITAGALQGTGEINANGGPVWNSNASGAGGRIAVTLTNTAADFDNFTGSITACGGWKGRDAAKREASEYPTSGAGTIYLRSGGEALDEGTLIIDNADSRALRWTEIGPGVTGRRFKHVIIRNGGRLKLADGEMIEVSGDFSNSGELICGSGAGVRFVGAADSISHISGTTTFTLFECAVPGKVLEFEAGKTNAIAAGGALVLQGTAAKPLTLRSSTSGTLWGISLDPLAGCVVEHASVKESDAASGNEVVAINSADNGNNSHWRFADDNGGETITWTGNASDVWGVAANWDLNRPPSSADTIIIPAGKSRYPLLTLPLAGASSVKSLQIVSGAQLQLNGFDLTICENLTMGGSLIASADEMVTLLGDASFSGGTLTPAFSTMALAGSADQTVNLGGLDYNRVTLDNESGVVKLTGGATLAELACDAPTGTRTISVSAGTQLTVQRLLLNGSGGNILLRSLTSGTQWKLQATGYRQVSGVDVKDCDASPGVVVPAAASTDSGNNLNWDFANTVAVWKGSSSSDFNTAANWNPAVVPAAGTRIVVDAPTRQLNITAATTLRDLTIANGAVRLAAPAVICDSLSVLDGGILLLDKLCVVSNAVTLFAGGKLTHTANGATEDYKLNLQVLGDMTLDAGSVIDVSERGYGTDKGPGVRTNLSKTSGACHGGRGDFNAATYPSAEDYTGNCYGSVCAPTNCGSGGGSSVGGGAAIITVSGILAHNGAIMANGAWQHGNAGAGGSVFVTASQIKGSGTITANGGNANNQGQGGGGRIALVLTQAVADFSAFSGEITAYGGKKMRDGQIRGGAGTIYLERGSESAGHGKVIVDNHVWHVGYQRYTDLGNLPQAPARELRHARLEVRNRGMVRLLDDIKARDIHLVEATTHLNLQQQVLTVGSRQHPLGGGIVTEYGEITWLADGLIIILR